MRKVLFLIPVIFFIARSDVAEAATVFLDNYYYAHANTPGTFVFKDKYGNTAYYGDNIEFDATIEAIQVIAYGMEPGDTITARSSAGYTWTVTPGQTTTVMVRSNETISIRLTKTGYNEVWAALSVMRTYDRAAGENVTYYFQTNATPTQYGDLGPGGSSPGDSGNVKIVDGNYYYFPARDMYKYDYNPPSGVSYYELHYIDAAGNTLYSKTYYHEPTGIHYLTCNGYYEMRFYDASGQLVAKSPVMTTTEMIDPLCDSFAGDAGYNDFPVSGDENPDGTIRLTWDPVAGATSYEVWKDGEKLLETPDTFADVSGPGNYSIVAKGPGGVVGQTDLTIQGGCDGCKLLEDILSCPAWGDYMGAWESLLRSVIPPPPDWYYVAAVMRDTIVPAIGQEIVDRMPEIARIIADEFERREDPVYAPGDIPAYSPPYQLPQLQDMPQRINFDLDSGVPNFDPDFTGSEPFVIPDPSDIELSDEDAGYMPPEPTPAASNPPYRGAEPYPEPDPGYAGSAPGDDIEAPSYVVTIPDVTDPGREYEIIEDDDGTMPGYQGPGEDPDEIPDYQMTDDPMPTYQILER